MRKNGKILAAVLAAWLLLGIPAMPSQAAERLYGAEPGGSLPGDNDAPFSAEHTTVYHAAVEPTWQEQGRLEYWSCSHCELLFSDASAANAVTMAELAIDPMDADHDGVVTAADAAVYLSRGARFDASAVLRHIVASPTEKPPEDTEWSPYV